jgi:hypothetical protein
VAEDSDQWTVIVNMEINLWVFKDILTSYSGLCFSETVGNWKRINKISKTCQGHGQNRQN